LVNIIPYLRNNISISLTLSAALSAAAIALLLLASPLVLSNLLLLQPAQAQTNLSFRTPTLANGSYSTDNTASITFDAQGETFISSERLEANGTYQITDSSSGQVLSSGSISRVEGCCLSNPSNGDKITIVAGPDGNTLISTSRSTSASNHISVLPPPGGDTGDFSGPVECSNQAGEGNTTSSMTGPATTQDSDGDGITDSSDSCTHNSNPRCFKQGDTTTQQQSSTPIAGNQTR
jgi:hypothetical protein